MTAFSLLFPSLYTLPSSCHHCPQFRPGVDRLPFTAGGSRPHWAQAVLATVDTGRVRESTSVMREMMGRRTCEPPDGRFSHLLGRYVGWGAAPHDATGGSGSNSGAGVLTLPAERVDGAARERLDELAAAAGDLAGAGHAEAATAAAAAE